MIITVIAGPTASGKSARALALAQEKDGVVINADSMQVYGALPLLTAQPAAEDCALVPHRLYGTLPPYEACSAARWRELAIAEIEKAENEGKAPVLVGGTGLYIEALMKGLSPIPDVPPEIREEAMALQKKLGHPAFHAALAERDPVMAARLHPNDTQRLIRAWEVLAASGKSLSYWQSLPPQGPPPHWRFEVVMVMPDRSTMYERCDARFDTMMKAGALAEVAAYKGADNAPVTHALGFRPLREHLRGKITLDQAVGAAKLETRQYAKRQMTWFTGRPPASYLTE